MLNKEIFSI